MVMERYARILSLTIVFYISIIYTFGIEYFIKIKPNSDINRIVFDIQNNIKETKSQKELNFSRAFKHLEDGGLNRVYLIDIDLELSNLSIQLITKMTGVEYIEKVPEYSFFYTPNDYNSSTLWHLNTIDARSAWDIERGGKQIIIGLVDDGIDTMHSDLQPIIWKNVNEVRGNNIDDDNNGYVDDFFGWDAADRDNNPCIVTSDRLPHGTHCAGIAGAKTDNGNGIASIGFNIKIMPIKIGRANQQQLFNAYLGVEYAIVNGANVISMSWGGGPQTYSSTYQTLFDVANRRRIVCVAAAGNSYDSTMGYPAGYNHVISVGATDINDRKTNFSCYGIWVDVMAPGNNIYSTMPGNSYGNMSGTSMACPMVSGLCALMLSKNPALSPSQVESCLKSTCDNINSQNSSFIGLIGAGRINAYAALGCIKRVQADFSSTKKFVCPGDTVRFFDQSAPISSSRIWSFQGGTPAFSSALNPIVRYNTTGTYRVELISTIGPDSDTILKTNYIVVSKPKATFSGVQSINNGEFGTVKVDLTGNPPWTLIYTDGKKIDTITNILNSPYYILKLPDTTTIYKPISMKSSGCNGDVFDSTIIKVNYSGSAYCDSTYRFHLNFGGNNDDQAYDIAVGGDTFIYIAGKTNSNGAGNYDAFVAKLGHSGKIYWYRTLGGSQEDGYLTITIDDKQNVYCGGYSHSNVNYRAAMMVKYDKNGNLKWRKYYNGIEREYLYDVIVSKDKENVYFTGHSISDSYGGEDYCIYKLDTSGNTQWVKRYGSSSTERPLFIVEDDSLNVYALGSAAPGAYQRACIVKVDETGSMIFSKTYTTSNSNDNVLYSSATIWKKKYLYAVGSALLSSSSTRRLVISKLNLNGTVVWSREISYGNMGPVPKIKIIDDKIVLISYTSVSSRNYGLVLTLDTNANVLTSKQIGSNSLNTFINDFELNSDKSLSYVGYQSSSNNQFVVGKTNCKFDNVCLFNSITPNSSSHTLSQSNYFLSSKNFTSVVTPNHANSSYNLTTTFNCKSTVAPIEKKCRLGANFSIERNCTGENVFFTDKSIDSSGFFKNNYYWDFGDGGKTSGFTTIAHKYQTNGNYNVRLIVTSASGNLTCSDTIIKTYKSTDSLFIDLLPNDTFMCIGDSISLKLPLIKCGLGPYKYNWSPAIGVSDTTIIQPYFSPKSTTTYKLTVRNINGMIAQDTVHISVNRSCCKSKARFAIDKEEICIGDSVQFTNQSSYNNGTEFFRWVFKGANINSYIGFNPPKVVFTPGVTNQVTLHLSDICSNDSTKMNTYLRRLPIVDAGRDTNICRKDTFKIGGIQLGRDYNEWFPKSGLDDAFIANPTVITDKSISYILEITNEFGCKNKDTIFIKLEPQKMHISNDSSLCYGDSVILKMPINGKYLWSSGAITKDLVVKTPGLYWGERTIDCISRDTVKIDFFQEKMFIHNDTFLCPGDNILLEMPLNGKYLWSNGSVNKGITIQTPGVYWGQRIEKCISRDTILVLHRDNPSFKVKDTFFCKGENVQIISPIIGKYLWSNGSVNNSIQISDPGNYWLNITDSFCDFRDTFTIIQEELPKFSLGSNRKICYDSISISPSTLFINAKYNWNNGSNSPTIKVKSLGQYILSIENNKSCKFTDTVIVLEGNKPNVEPINNTYKCINTNHRIELPVFPGQTYTWFDQSSGNVKVFPREGKYFVKASTECGDTILRFEIMDTSCLCEFYVPNAFSPNNDGVNDVFGIEAQCNLIEYTLKIFNRWGEVLYESNNMNDVWDGTYKGELVPVGVYFYLLEFRKDLSSYKEYFLTKGSINVLR